MAGLWEVSTDDGATFTNLDDLFFNVASSTGTGMLLVNNQSSSLAQQPGSLYGRTAILDRPFSLIGSFNTNNTSTKANFHSRKATLLKALNANAATKINARPSPIQLKYTGAAVDKVINCYYEDGFQDSSLDTNAFSQDPVILRFIAFDPFFYATSESSLVLDRADFGTLTVVAGKIGGVWDVLGPPNASGTYTSVLAVAADDTYIYFGGNFSNFDNIAAADNIVRMNKTTQVYSALASGLNGPVTDLAIAPNGDLYAVGFFTSAGDEDYIARWDGAAWNAVGTPTAGTAAITNVQTVAIGNDGSVYVGGIFTNWANIANADRIARWDGSAWNAMGTGAAGDVNSIVVQSVDKVYALGSFTSMGGVGDTDSAALWNGTAWESIGAGTVTGVLYTGALSPGGELYVGGTVTAIGGISVSRIAVYNGTSWRDVGSGVNNDVRKIAVAPNNDVYVAGLFTQAGGALVVAGLTIWNGSIWVRVDISLPGTDTVYDIAFDGDDTYIGYDTDGSGSFASNATEAYAGSAVAYPYITINRDGGNSAKIISVSNVTTGAKLFLDYDILDGETLTLDLRPFSDTALTASSSFFGIVPNAIQTSSNIGQFYLTPGRGGGTNDNIITLYITVDGAPTMTSTLLYLPAYLSQD